MQFMATATSYGDALTSKGSSSNSATRATRAREGIKSHQILLDSQSCSHSEGILCGMGNTGLVKATNKAIRDMDDPRLSHTLTTTSKCVDTSFATFLSHCPHFLHYYNHLCRVPNHVQTPASKRPAIALIQGDVAYGSDVVRCISAMHDEVKAR